MIYWVGIYWVCAECGTVWKVKCPICEATPENTKHSKECCCKKCEPVEAK